MHENFILACGGTLKLVTPKIAIIYRSRASGEMKTYDCIKRGLTVAEIAKENALTEGTIIKHIENLLKKGEIIRGDIFHLIKGKETETGLIFNALKKSKDGRLKPVHNALKGKYSYDLIRIVRMIFDEEK